MKNSIKIITIIFLLFISDKSLCQNFDQLKLSKAEIIPNAIGEFSLSVNFQIEKKSDEITDDEYNVKPNKPNAHISYEGTQINKEECKLLISPYLAKSGFGFKITGFNKTSIKQFLAKDNLASFCSKDLRTFAANSIDARDSAGSLKAQ